MGPAAQALLVEHLLHLEAAKQKVITKKTELMNLKAELGTKVEELKQTPADVIEAKIAEIDATMKNLATKFAELKDSILEFVGLKFADLEKQKASGDKYKELFTSALGVITSVSDGVKAISDKVTGVSNAAVAAQ
jgi:adenylosuccinate lyase